MEREVVEKATPAKVEQETNKKTRLETKELAGQKATKKKSNQPKKVKPNIAVIIVLIWLVGMIALVSFPLLTKLFSQTSTPTPLSTEITDSKGVPMRLVPAGEFRMGSENGKSSEMPVHMVYLNAFYMDKYEVTNALYKACVEVGGCIPPQGTSHYNDPKYENHPVMNVDWNQSNTYCKWRGAHLPTEAQWEKAARGTDGRTYPWGNVFDGTKVNFCDKNCSPEADKTVDDGYADTSPVGNYESGKSPYGIYDLAGNVWEWTADWYSETYYQSSPSKNPLGPDSGQLRVSRGGSWYNSEYGVRTSNRGGSTPDDIDYYFGFRCARSAP